MAIGDKASISPTFLGSLFTDILSPKNYKHNSKFKKARLKSFIQKGARKMLVKLTHGLEHLPV